MGLASCLFFLLLLAGAASPAMIYLVDGAFLLLGAALLWLRRKAVAVVPTSQAGPGFRWNWLLALVLLAGLLVVCSALLETVRVNPHGAWDAWSIWNVRAKFLAGPGDTWKNAVSPLLERSHADYPLLLSAFIARVWKSSGGETSNFAPILTGFLFAGCALSLLVASLALLRGVSAALLAGLTILTSSSFLLESATQYADVPLSFYYLATLALVMLSAALQPGPQRVMLALAGVFASFAAWTKNEGLVFVALTLTSYLLVEWRVAGFKAGFEKWRYLLLGALPGLLLVAYLKLILAPVADPLVRQTASQALGKLGEFSRYTQLGQALLVEALNLGEGITHPLLLLLILALTLRLRPRPEQKGPILFCSLSLALVFVAYCGVYLITPSGLAWHLGTSLGRLYCQLWPGFLLVAFMLLGRAEDTLAPAPQRTQKRAPAPRSKKAGSRA